jgi:hypothetical protein
LRAPSYGAAIPTTKQFGVLFHNNNQFFYGSITQNHGVLIGHKIKGARS